MSEDKNEEFIKGLLKNSEKFAFEIDDLRIEKNVSFVEFVLALRIALESCHMNDPGIVETVEKLVYQLRKDKDLKQLSTRH